jgi:hypothetical protein
MFFGMRLSAFDVFSAGDGIFLRVPTGWLMTGFVLMFLEKQ